MEHDKEKTMTTITRVGFCPECYRANRPKTGQLYRAFGSTRDNYFTAEAVKNGLAGYVPHIYHLHKVVGENVILYRICAVQGCGYEWKMVKGVWNLCDVESHWQRLIYTLGQWNALVMYKHDLDYEI